MNELWSKAQTRQEIIDRSGTKFNSALDMDLAMRDAETRLQSGGGLLGKGGLSVSGILGNKEEENTSSIGDKRSLSTTNDEKTTESRLKKIKEDM